MVGSRLLVLGASGAEAQAFFGEVLGLVPVEAGHGWQVFAPFPADVGPAGDGRARLCLTCTDIASAVDALHATPAGVLASIRTVDRGRLVDAKLPGGGQIGLFEPGRRSAGRPRGVAAGGDGVRTAGGGAHGGVPARERTSGAVVRGLTERRHARRAAERSDLLWECVRDVLLVVRRADGRILEANRAAETAYGYSRRQLLARTVFDLSADDSEDLVEAQMSEASRGGALFQTVHRRSDGSTFPVEVSSRGTAGPGGEAVLISVIRDITHRRRVDEVLKQVMAEREALAMTDALSGVANRRAFGEMAQLEIERSHRYGHPLSLAFLDIDDFKRVNDERGHTEGDRVLQSFAGVLTSSVRSVDGVARLGGDEFVVMMPETGADEALALAYRLSRSLASLEGGGGVTCSIGVATFVTPPDSVDRMVEEADRLLRAAKAAGKNGVRFSVVDQAAGEHGAGVP
jgi:diguanylate cyclase (GGDEF)-like protein/PAS domain S-box-containing protein